MNAKGDKQIDGITIELEEKEITQEVDKTIIHICHLLQNVNSTDAVSMPEYASVTKALADLTEARAHLDKKGLQPLYIPYTKRNKKE